MPESVIYRRFSTDEQEHGAGDTLSRQSRLCGEFARKRNWLIARTLTDKGLSAYKGEHLRPDAALGKFVASVERGEVLRGTVLIVERLDRLSRRPVTEALAWLFSLTARGISVAIVDKNKVLTADMSLEDLLVTALSFGTGHEESEKKSGRILDAKKTMWAKAVRREGKWTNLAGRPPLWLSRNSDCDGWVINEQRVEFIGKIFGWAADGLGASMIAKRINAVREPAWGPWRKQRDMTWGRTSIRQLIANPAVEGDFVGKAGMFQGQRIESFYPRIVDADLVARARAATAERRKIKGVRVHTGSSNLFSGLTMCGECGRPAHMTTHRKENGRSYRYLRCEGAADNRCCRNKDYYRYDAFEEAALNLCIDLALGDRYFEASGDLRQLRVREAELEKVIRERRARREKLMLTFAEDDELALELMHVLKGEISSFRKQLNQTRANIEIASGKACAADHMRRVNDIRQAADSNDLTIRDHARSKLRLALSSIINRVTIERRDGLKVFTLSLIGGAIGTQISDKGVLVATLTEPVIGSRAHDLTVESRKVLEPLRKRLEQQVHAA